MSLPRLFFVHVPKTGGTALYNGLKAVYGAEATLLLGHTSQLQWFRTAERSELEPYRLICGHLSIKDFLAKGFDDCLYTTVVRDPYEQVFSAYHYVRGWDGHPLHAEVSAMSFEAYIEHFRSTMRTQTWQVTGEKDFEPASPALSRYDVLAPYAQIAEATARISEAIGRDIPLYRFNETNYPPGAAMTPAQRDLLAPKIADDVKLYDHALRHWETQGPEPA